MPPLIHPFVEYLSLKAERRGDGRSEFRYEPRPEHKNGFDATHGGMMMALLDIAMAQAAQSAQSDMTVMTIEMKSSFFQPGKGELTARGRVLHRTRKMAFVEGTLYDAQGNACCHATGTFKYVKPAPFEPGAETPS